MPWSEGAARPHRQARQSVSQLLSRTPRLAGPSTRGPLAVAGRPEALQVSTVLNGTFRATGQMPPGRRPRRGHRRSVRRPARAGPAGPPGKTLDQRVDIRGNVTVTSRPALLPTWRLEPNLAGQVSIADSVAVDPRGQAQRLERGEAAARSRRQRAGRGAAGAVRNDPFIELAAPARMGQDVPLDPARRRRAPACRISGSRCAPRALSPASRASTRPPSP